MAYLKLQAHTASLQSLKECYCRYAHMLDGARTMFNAFQQTSTKRDSIDQVKLGLKECTQVCDTHDEPAGDATRVLIPKYDIISVSAFVNAEKRLTFPRRRIR